MIWHLLTSRQRGGLYKLRRLHLYRGVRSRSKRVPWIRPLTASEDEDPVFRECGVPLHCHYS